MIRKTSASAVLGLMIAVSSGGCAAILDGTGDTVSFSSTPPGAHVVAGDKDGTTPFTVNMKKSVGVVHFSHPNHPGKDAFIELKYTWMGGYALLDILFTPGFGIVGLLIDGLSQAWSNPPDQVDYDFGTGIVEKGGRKLSEEEVKEFKEKEANRKKKTPPKKKATSGRR